MKITLPLFALPQLAHSTLLALLSGALSILSFAPFGFWPLQIATLAFLFWSVLRASSVKHSILIGWAFGFGWAVCGVYWQFISMHRYGGLPAWMAALAVALMALMLGAYAGLGMGLAHWMRRRWQLSATCALLLVFPATWALGEWLRGWLFTGFPWVVSGYAHTGSPLAGFAPIFGVYGVGWLAALLAASLALLPEKKWPLGLAACILAAGFGLQAIHWTEKSGQPISVRLLQGNVPQEQKFEENNLQNTLALYDKMIRAVPADLIVTPETALPLLPHQLPQDYMTGLEQFSDQSNSQIIIGMPINGEPRQYANSVIGLSPEPPSTKKKSRYYYRYDKHHLVPFGEFIPPGFRWFVDMMRIPLGDFTRGAAIQERFAVKDQWVLPNICYEDLFGEEIADQIAAPFFAGLPQPTILLNVSNIAWFGDSIAIPQHLQISQMRALETGRPMLRATNTGATAVITPDGKVAAQLPPYTVGTLAATVQGMNGVTPYIRCGNLLIVGLASLMLLAAWLMRAKAADR